MRIRGTIFRGMIGGALAFGLAAPVALHGQDPDSIPADSTVYRVRGVSVQAVRPVTQVGGASATELHISDLKLSASPTTADILRELPALHLRTNSRGEAEISVRGSGSRQVAVIVDGVPLTLGWDARTDVSVLPAGAVTDITFVRGLSSMLRGPNVLGGVVEMSLGRRRFEAQSSLSASATVDDQGGYATSALGERPFITGNGRGTFRVGAGYTSTPGFPLPGGVSEPIDTGDDLRLNTDAENLSGFMAMRWVSDDGPWTNLSASSFKAERGIGAEIGALEPRLWRYPNIRRSVVAVSGGTGFHDTRWGRGDLEASFGLDFGNNEIQSYGSRAYDNVIGIEEGKDRTATFRMTGDHTIGSRGDLAAAFTFSDIAHTETIDGVARDYQQGLMSLAAETHWQLLVSATGAIESLRLSLGGAWDQGRTPKTGGMESLGTLNDWGARVGLSALTNEGQTMFHAGLSRRGRFPSLRETYSEALDRFVPNPELRPEHLTAFETGITTRLGNGEVQVVGFLHDLSGAIRRVSLPGGKRQRVNSDELKSRGVEILLTQDFGRLTVGGDIMLQSVDLIDSRAAVLRPENLPNQSVRVWAEFPLAGAFDLRADARFTGSQFCLDPNDGSDVKLDGGTWLSATLSRVWGASRGRRFETSVSAENLADTALYDQCGLPRAGRLLRMNLRVF